MKGYLRLRFNLSPERKSGRLMLAGANTVPALRPGVYLCIPRGVGPLRGRALFFTSTRLGRTQAVLCVVGPDLSRQPRGADAPAPDPTDDLEIDPYLVREDPIPVLDSSCSTSFDDDPIPLPPEEDPLPGLSARFLRHALNRIVADL